MNRVRRLIALVLFLGLVTALAGSLSQAQSPCPHVIMRLDSEQTVDADAICQAARPWADKGIRIFIFLTDVRPQNQDDWFALLDRVEADVGLRDLSQPDSFDKAVLAFETSTAVDLSWASSITYGELLYDTPLDSDTVAFQIKAQMQQALASGDPTQAFVQAVNTAHQANHPLTTAQAKQVDTPHSKPEPAPAARTEEKPSFPWGWAIVGVLGVGVLGTGGYGLTIKVIKPMRQQASHRADLMRHLKNLRARTANLLNAGDRLLQGTAPQETVLYELFSAYGGEHYPEKRDQVLEWLDRCQGALDDAFDLRKKLLDPAVQEQRTLEQTVQDWEMLYITFVGNSERVLALTDDELRTLLDPLLILERSAPDAQLTSQLDDLRRELVDGIPLKVELRMIDPSQADAEGILGYIEQVKAQIASLLSARQDAPARLAEAKAQRLTVGESTPQSFVMTEEQLFSGIDQQLVQAEDDLKAAVFLHVIERAEKALRDLATVQNFITTLDHHKQRQVEIQAITAQGYRPDSLKNDLHEIEKDLQTITHGIKAGDYAAATPWIEEMDTDSQRALQDVQKWRALHKQNTAALRQFTEALVRLDACQATEATPASKELESYPDGNWADVKMGFKQAKRTLQRVKQEWIPQIEDLNSMTQQRFILAEQMLGQAAVDLAQAERQLQAVVHRLAEVRTAAAHIQEALLATADDLAKATQLRDQEDPKVGPEIDQQLQQARERLTEAQRLAQVREFISATSVQIAARELAIQAYAAASDQVQEINELQTMLKALTDSVNAEVARCNAAAQALPAVVQTEQINQRLRQVEGAFSKAQQARAVSTGLQDHALIAALRAAVTAYQEVDQLTDWAMEQIAADRATYDRALTDARDALHAAQSAIQRASWAVRDPDANNAGSRALQRAQSKLSEIGSTEGATREALARLRQTAQEAQQDAQQAEYLARQEINTTQAERRRQRQRASRSSVFSGGWVSSSKSSRRSYSPLSGSSRRSSSFGSSRRSSSRGTSRRR